MRSAGPRPEFVVSYRFDADRRSAWRGTREAWVGWRCYRLTAAPPAGEPCLRHSRRTGRVFHSPLTSDRLDQTRASPAFRWQAGTGPPLLHIRPPEHASLSASPCDGTRGGCHRSALWRVQDAGAGSDASNISGLGEHIPTGRAGFAAQQLGDALERFGRLWCCSGGLEGDAVCDIC